MPDQPREGLPPIVAALVFVAAVVVLAGAGAVMLIVF
jgi:flagellin-like protein